MDSAIRLIAIILACCSGFAHSYGTVQKRGGLQLESQVFHPNGVDVQVPWDLPPAVCGSYAALRQAALLISNPSLPELTAVGNASGDGANCYVTITSRHGSEVQTKGMATRMADNTRCPPFSSQNPEGSCTCAPSSRPGPDPAPGAGSQQICNPYSCEQKSVGSGVYSASTAADYATIAAPGATQLQGCNAGCQTAYNKGACGAGTSPVAGYYGGCETNGGQQTGATCDSGGSPLYSGTTPPVKDGKCYGTVNGIGIYVPCASSTQSVQTVAETKTPDPANPGQDLTSTQTQTQVVTCANGSCSTTVIVSTSAPSTGGQGSVSTSQTSNAQTGEPNKTSFCKENPNASICRNSTVGGSCDSFTCDGDAVTCSIAKEIHRRNCEFFEDGQAASDGRLAATGTARPTGHPGLLPDSVNISTNSFDQTNPWGGSCPADPSVSLLGRTVVLQFSRFCTPAQLFGALVVAFSLLAAVRIVVEGV